MRRKIKLHPEKTGPKPMDPRPDVMPLLVRDVPNTLRYEAKIKAAVLGIPLREFVIQALEEKIATLS